MRRFVMFTVLGLGLLSVIGCDQKPDSSTPTKTEAPGATPSGPTSLPTTGPASAIPEGAAGEVAEAPTNVKCPVSGDGVNPKDASLDRIVYKGKTYVFCCNDCKGIFKKDPEKAIASLANGKAPEPAMDMAK